MPTINAANAPTPVVTLSLGNHPSLSGPLDIQVAVVDDGRDPICGTLLNGTFQVPVPHQLIFDAVKPHQTVLDLGCHIGTFSLIAAALSKEVITVDGSARNVALLQNSIRLNAIQNIRVIHAAVSDKMGVTYFRDDGAYGGIERENTEGKFVEVPAVSVDSLLQMLLVERVDFIKMDVEGAELLALEGMKSLLSEGDAPILVFESNGFTLRNAGSSPQELIRRVMDFGFTVFLPRNGLLHPVNSGAFQSSCVADYVAIKPSRLPLEGWTISSPLPVEEMVRDLLIEGTGENGQVREYVARVVQSAPEPIVANEHIRNLMRRLREDSVPSVREFASWFQD